MQNSSRRHFIKLGTSASVLGVSGLLKAEDEVLLKGRIYKTLKVGMVKEGKTLSEKLGIAKAAGFEGIELGAPGFDIEEAKAAVVESGIPIDGTVCAGHWKIKHSDPDESVRAQALENLLGALRDTHAVGGHTVLLVVGHGNDGTFEEVNQRTIENIRKAIPLAARLGVAIAIENVWNHFGYDHEGDATQTAEAYANYVDAFDSPWVGMQFDIGNHWKYGSMGDWIRHLGKRIIKLDVKGFSREQNKFTAIGEGDLDFGDVRKALDEISYYGWCAAEVGGGDLAHLKKVSARMDKAFGLV